MTGHQIFTEITRYGIAIRMRCANSFVAPNRSCHLRATDICEDTIACAPTSALTCFIALHRVESYESRRNLRAEILMLLGFSWQVSLKYVQARGSKAGIRPWKFQPQVCLGMGTIGRAFPKSSCCAGLQSDRAGHYSLLCC